MKLNCSGGSFWLLHGSFYTGINLHFLHMWSRYKAKIHAPLKPDTLTMQGLGIFSVLFRPIHYWEIWTGWLLWMGLVPLVPSVQSWTGISPNAEQSQYWHWKYWLTLQGVTSFKNAYVFIFIIVTHKLSLRYFFGGGEQKFKGMGEEEKKDKNNVPGWDC